MAIGKLLPFRAGPTIGILVGLMLILAGVGTADAQTRYPYGEMGFGRDFRPRIPSWYVRLEYIALWGKGDRLPPLLTTSPALTPQYDAGVLGEPDTEVLLGGERLKDQGRQGGRLTFGHWLDVDQVFALEAQYWVVGEANAGQADSSSDGDPILARPFFNTETGLEDAQLIAYPDLVSGTVRADKRGEVHSIDVLVRYNWLEGSQGYVNLLAGYRYFRFREMLAIREDLLGVISVGDKFVTENDFHGIDLGGTLGLGHGPWLLDVTTKIALGDMRETLSINGTTSAGGVTVPGGWLAAPSNIGTYSDHAFAAIPEVGLRVSWVALDTIRLSAGYDLMFVTKVARTGDQIDTTVNPSQLANLPLARGGGAPSGALRPQAHLTDTTFWMQGVSFGAELRW